MTVDEESRVEWTLKSHNFSTFKLKTIHSLSFQAH